MSPYTGIQRWLHQLWLDISSARFWKAGAHHYLRMAYDMLAAGVALALLVFAFLGPAAAIAIRHSDDDAGLSFLSPPLAWLLAFLAVVAAAAILVFAPAVDAVIDRWLLSPSPTAALQYQVSALADARQGAVSSAQTERHRIERDLHDSVQPRLVSLAMTIGLAQTKLDTDLPAGQAADRRGARRRQERARRAAQRGARHRADDPGRPRAGRRAVGGGAARRNLGGANDARTSTCRAGCPTKSESVAYFVVAEALTNVAKHAHATQAVVTVRLDEAANQLHVSVFDDGRGGAAITTDENATGLRGLEERVRAARGTFTVSSPATGPTIITAVLPCAS